MTDTPTPPTPEDPDRPDRRPPDDVPPKRRGPAKGRRPVPPPPLSDRAFEAMRVAAVELVATAGGIVQFVDAYDGAVVVASAEQLGTALAEVARVNPAMRRLIQAGTTGGAYGGLIVASVGVALPIMANHGLLALSFAPPVDLGGGFVVGPTRPDAGASTPDVADDLSAVA